MMCGHYRQVSDRELEEIRNSRNLQESLVYSDRSDPPYGEYLDVGMYWQAIDFLLNWSESPVFCVTSSLKDIVFGGEPLDKDENVWFDFGPIRYFSPEQVQEISEHLNKITPENLTTCYDRALLTEDKIYPDAWWTQDKIDAINQLEDCYSKLVDFFKKATKSRKYILTYVTA